MDWQAFSPVANTVLSLVVIFYVFFSTRSKASRDDIRDVEGRHSDRLTDHGERLSRVEGVIGSIPTHVDLEKIHTRVNGIAQKMTGLCATVGELKGSMVAVERTMATVNEYLLNKDKSA